LSAAREFEVLTIGRVSVDLYPEQMGVPLADVLTFRKSLGGSPTNVAVAAARLGRRSAVVTKVGADGFGTYVHQALTGFGVDDRWVGCDPDLRTPLAFCEIHPPDSFPLLFYREPRAPDLNLTPADLDLAQVRRAVLFWTTGTGLSQEPSRGTTLEAMAGRPAGFTVHDLDYRPNLWQSSRGEAGRLAREAASLSKVVVGNQDEVEMATGSREPRRRSWTWGLSSRSSSWGLMAFMPAVRGKPSWFRPSRCGWSADWAPAMRSVAPSATDSWPVGRWNA